MYTLYSRSIENRRTSSGQAACVTGISTNSLCSTTKLQWLLWVSQFGHFHICAIFVPHLCHICAHGHYCMCSSLLSPTIGIQQCSRATSPLLTGMNILMNLALHQSVCNTVINMSLIHQLALKRWCSALKLRPEILLIQSVPVSNSRLCCKHETHKNTLFYTRYNFHTIEKNKC